MLLWLEDAPVLRDGELESRDEAFSIRKEICDFVDSIYTCSKKWDGSAHHDVLQKSSQETWDDLIKTRQTHRHTSTCMRKRGGNKTVCRFNIPFFPMKETAILTPLDPGNYSNEKIESLRASYKKIHDYLHENSKTLSTSDILFEEFLLFVGVTNESDYILALRVNLKLNKIYIKRNPNEIMINNYNRKILSMFISNMDIQYVLDPYACCAYVLDYINKADRGMSKAVEEIYVKHTHDPNSSSFELLKSLAATYTTMQARFLHRKLRTIC